MNSENIQFLDANISVEPDVFSPRTESEIFISILENYIKDNMCLLELGTGTGAISIAIALRFPNINITSVDKNIKAIECAKRNCKLNNVCNNISFLESDWFSSIKERKFDIIISNPPYLSKMNISRYKNLNDPEESLFAGDNGLLEIKSIIDSCKNYMHDKSIIMLEHSHSQTLEIKEYTAKSGICYLGTYHDDLGFNRVSVFKKI
ncbi:MAG: HemK family protein methyltransferase [Pseudomonadota bacterium]|nr:HemK family protein methyltransferase [Pseudomonadota bacterium]